MENNLSTENSLRGMICGTGQVMFQQNLWCSLLFLIGIFWGAWAEGRISVAWGGLVGLIVSYLTGRILGLKAEEGEQGLWGFNGVLVGCAIMTFLRSTPLTWCILIVGAAHTVWLREGLNRIMAKWKVNSMTMPFVLTTWMLLLAARGLNGLPIEGLSSPMFPHAATAHIDTEFLHLLLYWLRGIGQVFLIDSWITGLFFLAGLIAANGWSAFWAAFASALSLAVALLFDAPGLGISEGLYGFSPVLTGIALGSIFYHPSWRSALWAVVGIVITLFAQAATNSLLSPLGLPSLTAPFCFVTWVFLLPMFSFEKHPFSKKSDPSRHEADHSDWNPARKPHLKG